MPYIPQFNLQPHNSLAVPSVAQYYTTVETLEQLTQALDWAKAQALPVTVMGEGSNSLCPSEVNGLVVRLLIKGRTLTQGPENSVFLDCGAGENWHQTVQWALQQGLFGLENLALIPGSCGAAPIQNIGAYGVELAERLVLVRVFNRKTQQSEALAAEDCGFGYRQSHFKGQWRHSHIITHIRLRLSRTPSPVSHYPALQPLLAGQTPTPLAIYNAVCQVRQSKIPHPQQTPNCGSFFKNPVVPQHQLNALLTQYPHLPHYPAPQNSSKLAAGWLIQQAGLKGKAWQGVQVHPQQALVLTNPLKQPLATVLAAAKAIQQTVEKQFGVWLEIEPALLQGA